MKGKGGGTLAKTTQQGNERDWGCRWWCCFNGIINFLPVYRYVQGYTGVYIYCGTLYQVCWDWERNPLFAADRERMKNHTYLPNPKRTAPICIRSRDRESGSRVSYDAGDPSKTGKGANCSPGSFYSNVFLSSNVIYHISMYVCIPRAILSISKCI